jgi:cytoskeletal protein CcmA (bactofilin family)
MAWKRTDSDPSETTPYTPRPASEPSLASRRERAVIGTSITVEGDVSGEEDLTILGTVHGTVDVKGNSVTIGPTGKIKADVHAQTIVVEGEVQGNLFGGDQIVLRSSGQVRGNLTAPRVALEDGAQFKGSIDMEPKRAATASGSAAARAQKPPEPAAKPAESSSSGGKPSDEDEKAGTASG